MLEFRHQLRSYFRCHHCIISMTKLGIFIFIRWLQTWTVGVHLGTLEHQLQHHLSLALLLLPWKWSRFTSTCHYRTRYSLLHWFVLLIHSSKRSQFFVESKFMYHSHVNSVIVLLVIVSICVVKCIVVIAFDIISFHVKIFIQGKVYSL